MIQRVQQRRHMTTSYNETYFAGLSPGSRASAARIVPLVVQAIKPGSVIDVGCGTGEWLAEFCHAGVAEVVGVDGGHAAPEQLRIPAQAFCAVDLRSPLRLERRFDLAMSLEVAEHLPPERSESFVADLVALAPAVLFSAAIPGQPGTDHISPRWQDEWAEMFRSHGYHPWDLVRTAVWDDSQVDPWYAQNTLLYVDSPPEGRDRSAMPLRLVHPELYGWEPPLKTVATQLLGAVKTLARQQSARLRHR